MKKLLLVVALLLVSSASFAQLSAGKMAITTSGPSGATTSVFGTQGVGTSLTWWFN